MPGSKHTPRPLKKFRVVMTLDVKAEDGQQAVDYAFDYVASGEEYRTVVKEPIWTAKEVKK